MCASTAASLPPQLYKRLAEEIRAQIRAGVFCGGQRLPSVRRVSRQKRLSITTVRQAYRILEDSGEIEARPQSGYYVRQERMELGGGKGNSTLEPQAVQVYDLARRVREDANLPDLIQFGAALPAPDVLPEAQLNRLLARLARNGEARPRLMGSAEGCLELRVQVARRAFLAGCNFSPEEILITNGCTEALNLALRAVCVPGDLVAIESPTYFGILQMLEAYGLRAVEIPAQPGEGLQVDALQQALERYAIRAAVVVTNHSNPLGCCMSEQDKRRLVEMLAQHQSVLIEDDIYGELSFSDRRPLVARAFDTQGGVILCSSFSKSVSPGLRVGWMAPGKWREKVEFLKVATNCFSALLPQLTMAAFLEGGGFDQTLRRMRRAYAARVAKMTQLIRRFFPADTRVSSPQGGYVVWVQLPEKVDSLELYRRGLGMGITLAPGYLFATQPHFHNFIRLNAAMLSAHAEWAVQRLGEAACDLCAS